ncbi:hypothetical protein A2U01_0062853, partial [Trifolium medium]|nr:hypothetical protein [Trifolium medium]
MKTGEATARSDRPSERKGEGDAEDEESLVAPPNRAATSQIEALDRLGGKQNEG